jgi:hypothetical protein
MMFTVLGALAVIAVVIKLLAKCVDSISQGGKMDSRY